LECFHGFTVFQIFLREFCKGNIVIIVGRAESLIDLFGFKLSQDFLGLFPAASPDSQPSLLEGA
jgi:hypothetical protein